MMSVRKTTDLSKLSLSVRAPKSLIAKTALGLFILAVFVRSQAAVDTEKDASNTPEKSQELLLNTLPRACFVTGEFTQSKMLAGFESPLKSKGDFIYSCEKGLIWRTIAPVEESSVYPLRKTPAKSVTDSALEKMTGRAQKRLGALLNNLIGTNHEYLEKTFQVARDQDQSLVFIPRKKRMRKFINAINITPRDNGASILLRQRNDETLLIDIVNTKEHNELSFDICSRDYRFTAATCKYLYD